MTKHRFKKIVSLLTLTLASVFTFSHPAHADGIEISNYVRTPSGSGTIAGNMVNVSADIKVTLPNYGCLDTYEHFYMMAGIYSDEMNDGQGDEVLAPAQEITVGLNEFESYSFDLTLDDAQYNVIFFRVLCGDPADLSVSELGAQADAEDYVPSPGLFRVGEEGGGNGDQGIIHASESLSGSIKDNVIGVVGDNSGKLSAIGSLFLGAFWLFRKFKSSTR